MKQKLFFGLCVSALLSIGTLTACSGGYSAEDQFDEKGRLILNLKNLYFEGYDGTDNYTEVINEKFGVHVKASHYDYSEWDNSVNTAISGNTIPDVFHYNLKAYNFGTNYEFWVKNGIVKPLPDDMSKWPNLQNMLSHVSNVKSLKIDGKLYGIPIMNDIVNYEKDFSNMTYMYRRDWVKMLDQEHTGEEGFPLLRENDEYTWDEFQNLLKAFKSLRSKAEYSKMYPLADESWGFPAITNFYKDVPHCYAKDAEGKAINAFTSDKYVAGLQEARRLADNGFYHEDQYQFDENKAKEKYKADQVAVYYDNFSLANYITLRDEMRPGHQTNLDDATAFLKIKDPNGYFALEGTENWFSMSLFNYDISDFKMGKILDILDYLLSEEGTRLAIFGIEGYDYNMVDGKPVITSTGWEKDDYGDYIAKTNGAKFLRYMATLGNDTKPFDPLTKEDAFEIFNKWQEDMKAAKAVGKLRIVKEPADIDWMSTPAKNDYTEGLLADANTAALKYAFDSDPIHTIEDYLKTFDNYKWRDALKEINEGLKEIGK